MSRDIVVKYNNDGTVTIKEEDYNYLIKCVREYNALINVMAERTKTMEAVNKILEKD